MPNNLDTTISMIAQGLQDEARQQLIDKKAVRTGALLRSTEVFVRGGDDFVVDFLDYGVFINDGARNRKPRPFYSNLVSEGNEEGVYEDEITEMLEDAFDEDINEINDIEL